MGQRYRQLDSSERDEISRLSAAGCSIRQIAAALDRAPSSVARELKRNGGKAGYGPGYAGQQARARRWTGSKLERNDSLREQVLTQLIQGWSPEQIVGRSRRSDGKALIGVETIYRFVYVQIARHNDFTWRKYLPRAKSRRGWRPPRGGSPALHMSHRRPIQDRPADVDDRLTPGHWEADLMAFARYGQNVLMLHERTSRALIGARLPSKEAEPVARAIADTLLALPEPLRQTLTFDNGTEFARHYQLNADGIATYFCDPHAPWQKGGIENAIGRMRRFLPRKTDLASLDNCRFNLCLAAYNNTPRKCLDWITPAEAFSQLMLHFKRESTSRPAPG